MSGAGRGIGRAIGMKLAQEGARVVLNDLDAEPVQETIELVNNATVEIEGRKIKIGVNQDLIATAEHAIPLGRLGTPEEGAGAVYLLCLPESNYISGETLVCSGGFMM